MRGLLPRTSWGALALGMALLLWLPGRPVSGQAPAPPRRPATAGASGLGGLQAAWEAALAAPGLRHASVSAYAFDLQRKEVLAAIHPDWQLTPASLTKLFTSVEALATLGPSFRYRTTLALSPGPDGPTLYLVGGGDPWLEANGRQDLEHLAQLAAAKLHGMSVRLVGVSALFGGPSQPGTGWPWEDLPANYTPRLAALTAERDQAEVLVAPGGSVGAPARVVIDPYVASPPPPPAFLWVEDEARTTAPGTPRLLSVTRALGSPKVVVKGQVPLGAGATAFYVSLPHPARLATALFAELLARAGVQVQKPVTVSYAPPPPGAQVLAVWRSRPLAHDLQIQNTYSVNLMAENLWRMVAVATGHAGTAEAARQYERAFLQRIGLPPTLTLVDGSGLSPLDRVSARAVVDLLRYAASEPWFPQFEHSLIHVGRTDQCSFLCGLMDQSPADGTVWLKTGNLSNQWNYAGYARTRSGDLVAFAILMDGLPTGRFAAVALPAIDQMTEDVAAWPEEPAPLATGVASAPAPPPPALRPYLPAGLPALAHGVALVSVADGQLVYGDHAEMQLKGGTVAPLFTVAAALRRLPAKLSGVTLYAVGRRSGAVLRGDLLLDPGQDVTLSQDELEQLARRVARSGLREVLGGIADLRGYTPTWQGGRWPRGVAWELLGTPSAPVAGDAVVDGGIVSLVVQGGRPGDPAAVTTDPPGLPLTIVPEVTTAIGAPKVEVRWARGRNAYVVSGTVPPGGAVRLAVAPPNPEQITVAELRQDLARAGVLVRQQRTADYPAIPPGAVRLAALPGPSLERVVRAALAGKVGDILGLYRLLGPDAARLLAAEGAPSGDPSGIGLEDYTSAAAVAELLAKAARLPVEAPLAAFFATPHRWRGPESSAEAGYLTLAGRRYAFAVLLSGLPLDPAAPGVPPSLCTCPEGP